MTDAGYRRVYRIWGIVLYVPALLLALVAASPAADPPKVRLPAAPTLPQPMPSPDAPITLTADLLLVCDSDVECVVLCSPKGRLKVTPAKGPVTARGKFVDGTGVEMRTFAGPWLYFVEAAEPGECELIVVPVGGREADVLRRRVVSQTGPLPPPKPDPIPDPKPKPTPPDPQPTAARVCVVVVEETAHRTPAQGKVLYDAGVREWLKAGKHEIEILDKDDAAAKANGYLPFAERVGLPAVLVFDADGKGPQVPLAKFRLPDDPARFKDEIGKAVKR